MEKSSSITSSDFIAATFRNISLNSNLTISKINELLITIKKASKAIILPVLKMEKKISLQLENFTKNYIDIKSKADCSLKELDSSEGASNILNITDIQLNQKYANEHEEFINFYDSVSESLNLFTNLVKSEQFIMLIKGFDKIISDSEIYDAQDMDDIDKIDKDNIKLKSNKNAIKKKKVDNKETKDSKGSSDMSNQAKVKKSKNLKKLGGKTIIKKKKGERDLLEIVQKEFPSSSYVQKLSKTFLKRRLTKKVIYKHIFSYSEEHEFTEERIRSSGDSTVYKYGKFTFTFRNMNEEFEKFFGEKLKQVFIKRVDEKILVIAGKISGTLNEVLDGLFRKKVLSEEYHIEKAFIEFYEFYEELISEFDPKEKNIKIICDEKYLNHLNDDWKMLKEVREFVAKFKN